MTNVERLATELWNYAEEEEEKEEEEKEEKEEEEEEKEEGRGSVELLPWLLKCWWWMHWERMRCRGKATMRLFPS